MNDQDKTKEKLLEDLMELRQKYNSLRESFDEETSERKRAQKALKESEDKYKIAFHSSRDSINITERDGTYIDINEGFTNITGFTREDIIGKLSQEINIWAIPEDLEKLVAGLKQRGYIENLESKFRCKDGSLKTAIISANIIILNNEPNILIVSHDITERKQMEELILKSKKQYDDLVSNIPVGVYVMHSKPQGTFALDYVSPRMAEMLDISVENLTASANAIFKVIHPDDLEGFKRLNDDSAMQKRPFDWKGRVVIKNVVLWLHISSMPMELGNGDILWNGLIVDITEQVLAKAEIEHQNKELQKINAEKDKFFSIIAHDLRSPFNGFLGLTQIMAEELPSLTMSEVQDIAMRMSKSAENLYRLLNNLLEWSQIQEGAIRFRPEVIHLELVIVGIIDIIQESAKSKGIDIETHIPDGLVVCADANMLQTILRNLLSNALKFTPKGGNMNVSAKPTSDKNVEISIQDTGIGMNQILLDNLFRIDVQSYREGTDKEPSSGLGLLLCKEFVEKQGGELWVESEEGIGSTFYFTLPTVLNQS
ncbi:MAG TPA: ATP-binding protein [Prolixibacteraceae bacterium]